MRVIIALQKWIVREVGKPRPEVRLTPGGWVLCGEARDEHGINARLRAIDSLNREGVSR